MSGLLLSAVFCQCAPKESAVSVQVKNWPAAATRLRVLPTFAGQSKLPGQTFFIEPGTSEFSVYVPTGLTGRAVVEGMVEDSEGCYVAGQITQAQFTDQPSIQRVELNLKLYEQKQCPIQSYSRLEKIWMDRKDNAWTVGENGTILRWNGAAWFSTLAGRNEFIAGVWSGVTGEVWVVGTDGLILRWDGSAWTQQPGGTSRPLSAIWGMDEADLWAVGEIGTVLRWNGTIWSSVLISSLPTPPAPQPYLTDVWGSDPSNVWIVGSNGFIVHWDGTSWSPPQVPTSPPPGVQTWPTRTFTNVYGISPDRVWISDAGTQGNILTLQGSEWKLDLSGGPNLYGMWAADPYNVWIVGTAHIYKNNGKSWSDEAGVNARDVGFSDIAGADVFHAIAVGYKTPANPIGVFRYWNGSNWSEVPNF